MRMSGRSGNSLQKFRGKKEAVGEACIILWEAVPFGVRLVGVRMGERLRCAR